MHEKTHKLVIIGSGPAAYTAAIYAARADLHPQLYEGFFSGPAGGQLMSTTEVENFPGFPEGITGPQLMENMRKQALKFGTHILAEDVESVELSSHPFVVKGAEQTCLTHSLIIATGASAKRLDIPGTLDGQLWQKGVTACAVCDGAAPLFRNKPLYVIGGGDTACEEALFLTKFGSSVTIVHRRDELRASKIMADRVLSHPKITVLWDRVVDAVRGERVVQEIDIRHLKTQQVQTYPAAGLFFAIGHQPNTGFLRGQIACRPNGYAIAEPGTCRSSVAGVFVAGDVQDAVYRQAVTAAGSGCMAALEAERWLLENSL